MITLLENYWELFDMFFESLIPIDIARYERDIRLWVKLSEIPLHLWHSNTFKAIGEC